MFAAVALGAFGAHALKARLAPEMIEVWRTAVQYQAWHALALVGIGLALRSNAPGSAWTIAGWLFAGGIALFSGSLYALALTGERGWGALTPVGGLAFLGGWAAFAWAAMRR